MANGSCEKKKCDKCLKNACRLYNIYNEQKLPCRYLQFNKRGFSGGLNEIDGKRYHLQHFSLALLLSLYSLLFFIVLFLLYLSEGDDSDIAFLMIWLIHTPVILLLLLLMILNKHFFGKTIAVSTKDQLFTNQFVVDWRDIKSVKFYPHQIGSRAMSDLYSYTEFITQQGYYRVAHLPISFLGELKKHNKEVEISLDKKRYVFYVILTFVAPLTLLIIRLFFTFKN